MIDDPCDVCPLHDRCIDLRIACEQFVAARRGEDWAGLPRKPTRALYESAQPTTALHLPSRTRKLRERVARAPALRKPRAPQVRKPRPRMPPGTRRIAGDAQARQWVGRVVRGREVTGFHRATQPNGNVRIVMEVCCKQCGHAGVTELPRLVRGTLRSCACSIGAEVRARNDARAAAWVGREVAGRVVTGWARVGVGQSLMLTLYCGRCGHDARYFLADVTKGRTHACQCRGATP